MNNPTLLLALLLFGLSCSSSPSQDVFGVEAFTPDGRKFIQGVHSDEFDSEKSYAVDYAVLRESHSKFGKENARGYEFEDLKRRLAAWWAGEKRFVAEQKNTVLEEVVDSEFLPLLLRSKIAERRLTQMFGKSANGIRVVLPKELPAKESKGELIELPFLLQVDFQAKGNLVRVFIRPDEVPHLIEKSEYPRIEAFLLRRIDPEE
jgi:hypothetical protein